MIDAAENKGLVSPKKLLNYLIGFILGLFILIAFILLRDYFDNKVRSKSQLEQITKVPVLGMIGHNQKDTNLVALSYPRSAITEGFRALRTNLQADAAG